jgi:hypothetical protein
MRLGHSCSPAAWPSGKKVVASLDHCGVKAKIADVNVGQRQARAVKAALTSSRIQAAAMSRSAREVPRCCGFGPR